MTGHMGAERGRRLGGYRLLEVLGKGGMGIVWRAVDEEFDREVALKVIRPADDVDQATRQRFLREARLAARLRHPTIVPVLDAGERDGQYFYVSPIVEGRALDDPAITGWPLGRLVELVARVTEGLAHAHEVGIVHRDIKPGNILVDERGQPRLLDFGLARDLEAGSDARLTGTQDTLGTPHYMSPEQAAGRNREIGPASDQFSLAVVLYELVTGQLPFDGDSLRDILNSTVDDDPLPPTRIARRCPVAVERVLLRAMKKQPSSRYPSIAAFGEALRASVAQGDRSSAPSRGALLATLVLVVVAVATLAGWLALRQPAEAPAEEDRAPVVAVDLEAALGALDEWRYRPRPTADERARRVAEARAAVDAAAASGAEPALVQASIGRIEAVAGRFDRAEAAWRAALEADPDRPEALEGLGRLLVVRTIFRPHPEHRKLMTGRDHQRLERLRSAADLLESFLASGRGSPVDRTVDELLVLYAKQSEDEMLRRLEPALGRHGDTHGAELLHAMRGRAAVAGGEVDIERATLLAPGDPWSALAWACALDDAGRHDEAGRVFDRLVEIAPGLAEVWFWRAWHHQLGPTPDPTANLADLDRAIDLDRRFVRALNNRGLARLRQGDRAGAMADLDAGILLDPNDAYLHFNRATVWFELEDLDQAIADLDQAIRLYPRFALGYIRRAEYEAGRGRVDEAIADCDAALAIDGKNADAFNQRGSLYQKKGELDRSIVDFTRALEHDADHPYALANRAHAHYLAGHAALGIADIEATLRRMPSDWRYRPTFERWLGELRNR